MATGQRDREPAAVATNHLVTVALAEQSKGCQVAGFVLAEAASGLAFDSRSHDRVSAEVRVLLGAIPRPRKVTSAVPSNVMGLRCAKQPQLSFQYSS